MSKQAALSETRQTSLDGLRGVAALVVVMHHLLLTLPWFADRVGLGSLGRKGHFTYSIHNIFEYSPLHILYGGTEAVMIFFVLSGYVLVNAVNKDSIATYVRFRLLRLYAPILIAVTFAAGLVFLFKHKTLQGGSWWLNSHAIEFTPASYFKNLWVVEGNDWLDSSLWTMRYEIFFSLAVLVLVKLTFKKKLNIFVVAILSSCGMIYIGMHYSLDLLGWLPVFFAGSALHWLPMGKIKAYGLRLVVGITTLFLPWCIAGYGYSLSSIEDRILMSIGAVLIVDVCRQPGNRISRLLSTRLPRVAGRYSYSLYLIHAPVLTTLWLAMGSPAGHIEWLFRCVIALVSIAIGTTVVYRLGEKPSLKWIHKHKARLDK
jgi:peptidoglycan/LPS O-acetylase OafA/YrhL